MQLQADHLQHHTDNTDADSSCQCVTHQPWRLGQRSSKLHAQTTATVMPTMKQPRQCSNDNNSHNDNHEDNARNNSSGTIMVTMTPAVMTPDSTIQQL